MDTSYDMTRELWEGSSPSSNGRGMGSDVGYGFKTLTAVTQKRNIAATFSPALPSTIAIVCLTNDMTI